MTLLHLKTVNGSSRSDKRSLAAVSLESIRNRYAVNNAAGPATELSGRRIEMTVAEKMMSEAVTQSERDLLKNWFESGDDPHCARQRAWDEVARRTRRLSLDLAGFDA
jgi:hypothetical protein